MGGGAFEEFSTFGVSPALEEPPRVDTMSRFKNGGDDILLLVGRNEDADADANKFRPLFTNDKPS